MNRLRIPIAALLALALVTIWQPPKDPNRASREFYSKNAYYVQHTQKKRAPKAERRPNDWFYLQRAYPADAIPPDARLEALAVARADRAAAKAQRSSAPVWTQMGPTNIPGRITDLAVHPSAPNTIYAAAAAGGVFKSTDLGVSWSSVFDQTGTESVGAIAIHPTDPNILYVGTGEANSSGDSYEGTGVYKSTDAGVTWTHIGLPNSFHIGRIVIDPLRPESLYVAVAGKLFGTNPDRGLYRSQDGGATWEQLLYVSDSTACVDVALDATTGTIFAGMWERFRNPTYRMVGGITTGLYRSSDFGATWSLLTSGLPPQSSTLGRIGVSVDSQTGTVWSIFFDHPGNLVGIYLSPNLGTTWIPADLMDITYLSGGFGWYFGQIRAVPGDPMSAYALGILLYKTTDGGIHWTDVTSGIHVDQHALYVLPSAPDQVYVGNDGGVAHSTDGGASWNRLKAMPNTQFYAITVNPLDATKLYGGTQDNGTLRTPGDPGQWHFINGGDGFYTLVDYADTNIIYAESQWGWLARSNTGGNGFTSKMVGIDYDNDRHNWNTPIAMDPTHHTILYYGSNRLYKTENMADFWFPISGDLTNGPGSGNLTFGTITTIDVAATDSQVVYVGTDDANVWMTQDGGGTWQNISATLPDRWVTRVTVDPRDAGTACVTFSGYKASSWTPHIYRTTDYGATWADIHGNLADAPINDVVIDPDTDSTLYIATDFGVYTTTDLGQTWAPLGTGMPIVPVHDLAFHHGARRLAAGTHGRSIFAADVDCPGVTVWYRDTDGDGFGDDSDILTQCEPPAGYVAQGGDCNDTLPGVYPGATEICNGIDDNCNNAVDELWADDDGDGVGNPCDNCPNVFNPDQADSNGNAIGDACDCACPYQSDLNADGQIDAVDLGGVIDIIFFSSSDPQDSGCPKSRGDFDCDGFSDAVDLAGLIDHVFFSGTPPCDPCAP